MDVFLALCSSKVHVPKRGEAATGDNDGLALRAPVSQDERPHHNIQVMRTKGLLRASELMIDKLDQEMRSVNACCGIYGSCNEASVL